MHAMSPEKGIPSDKLTEIRAVSEVAYWLKVRANIELAAEEFSGK